jgi:predicted neuraminidase
MRAFLVLLIVAIRCPMAGLPSAEAASGRGRSEEPFLRSELIFPSEHWHNHGSCVVETPRGDLLVCWFHGSGERKADDVKIEGARLRRGSTQWGPRTTWADTEGYPDTNCSMFFDPEGRLWLVWPTILANLWESALLKTRISVDFERSGAPRWKEDRVIHVTPGPEFDQAVTRWLPEIEKVLGESGLPADERKEVERYLGVMKERTGDTLYRRLGWMTRAHPYVFEGRRILLPLYHDGFSFSLMAVSDDLGVTWKTSEPLLGGGNIQPSLARRKDGTLVAQMRDNGPPPKRVMSSESRDGGLTWSKVVDTSIPNPGAGTELVALRDGRWLFIGNDTEDGRHRLVVMVSEDEGRTWPHRRYLENDPEGPLAGRYHYPSLIEARDGTFHATYSHHLSTAQELPKDADGKPAHSSIKHAHFNWAWIARGAR